MNCEKIAELMNEKLDGCISPENEKLLTDHLNTCESCRSLYETLAGLDDAIRDCQMEPPASLHEGVMQSIRREESGRTSRRTWGVVAAIAAVAAAFAILAGTGLVQMPGMQDGGKVNSLSMSEAIRAAVCSDEPDVPAMQDAFAIAEEYGCAVTVFQKCSGLKELKDAEHETTDSGAEIYSVTPELLEKLLKKYGRRYDSVTVLPKEVSREDRVIVMLAK